MATKQKRRIYDITNVLEGIGLIEKQSKNTIRWKYVDSFAETSIHLRFVAEGPYLVRTPSKHMND